MSSTRDVLDWNTYLESGADPAEIVTAAQGRSHKWVWSVYRKKEKLK